MQASLERLQARRAELQDEGGFTLIELLIVVVILGILAAIVVFAVQNLSSTSVQSACQSNFKTVETAVEAYKAQMSNYPSGSGHATGADSTKAGYTGSGSNTDSDIGTVVTFTTGSVPAYGDSGTGTPVNAAGAVSGANGTELFVNSTTAPNTGTGTAVGPWLKDVPANSGHYTIFVANDGSGSVAVLDSNNKVLAGTSNNFNDASACTNVK